jgi:GNAT superfamily N-acetyltransferase
MPADLRRIAHDVLCLSEPPYLKHFRRGRFRLWNGVGLTGSELPGPGFNFAAAVDPCPPLDAVLAAGRDYFADCGQGWGVLVEGGAGHPVEAEMIARGWAVAEDEPAFVLPDLTPSRDAGAGDLVVRPIRTEADCRAFQAVCTAAYGTPPDLAEQFMPPGYLRDPDMWWVIGEWAGEPVAAGGYFRVGSAAVVGGLATLEAHRGRGIGAAVARACLAHAAAAGCTWAVLRSGPKSVPLYERLGFRYACQHRTYTVPG